jgi:aminopeptidase
MNPFYKKLAEIAIKYSTKVKEGQRVMIRGSNVAQELALALYIEILKAGGHPFIDLYIEGEKEALLKYGDDNQIVYIDKVIMDAFDEFDALISIRSTYNTHSFGAFDQKRVSKMVGSEAQKKIYTTIQEREIKGELEWLVVPFPCEAYAQEANMDIITYSEFMKKALFLDKEDPIGEYRKMNKKQEKIVNYLNETETIQVHGEDTNLTLSVKGRKWINCSGERNLPDGEVFTSPVEDSVNGHIRFTYPGIYSGQEVEDIYLEFKDGNVSKAEAAKNQDLLKHIIKIDGANLLGEFAVGTNYGITQFTKNMLFDEKIGGTLHCALGFGPKETGSKNESSIHWDILKDMSIEGSKILADDEIIYKEGEWKI